MRRSAIVLFASVVVGCYSASGIGDRADAGAVVVDAASPPPRPPARDGDPTLCADAPAIGIDDRVDVADVGGARVPPEGSCWSGAESPRMYFRIDVPARTGVDLRTSGVDAPIVALTDGCTPAGERCRHLGPSGSFEPGERERTAYFGNVEDRTVSLVVSLWWAGSVATPFVLETQSAPLADHAACESARELAPGTLVPASSERGGTYESWSCNHLEESHFHSVAVPAHSVVLPLDGSQSLRAIPSCTCGDDPFDDLLVNEGEARPVLLEADPRMPIGVAFAPLPDNATCERAEPLPIDGVERELAPYPRLVSGSDECVYNDPHFYAIEIPPHRVVEVTVRIRNSPYGAIGVREACGVTCSGETVRADADGRVVELVNDGDAPMRRVIVVGADGPADVPVEGTVAARAVRAAD